MQKLEYQKVKFVAPRRITEEEFYVLKKKLKNDSNYKLDNGESFIDRFKLNLFAIGGMGLSVILFLIFGETKNEILEVLLFLSVFVFFGGVFGLFYLFAEGPSYATYLKDRKEYFDRLEYVISISSNYSEFKTKIFPW